MIDFSLTPSAKADLREIWSFIAEDNPEAADVLESDLLAACRLLAGHPEIGSLRPAWTDKPVRFWPVRRSYLIVYFPDGKPLQIHRILHAARNIPELIGE